MKMLPLEKQFDIRPMGNAFRLAREAEHWRLEEVAEEADINPRFLEQRKVI